MRKIGNIPDHEAAERFMDYLLTLGITSQSDEEAGGYAVWVHDDDHLERSKEELSRFLEAPDDSRFHGVSSTAQKLKREGQKRARDLEQKHVDFRRRWVLPVPSRVPVTIVLIVISVVVAMLTRFGKEVEPVAAALTISKIVADDGNILWHGSGLVEISNGEVWRLFTPMFLHFDIIHLVFNMYWLFILGGLVESRRGGLRYLLLVLFLSMSSNLFQYWMTGNPAGGGMSGVGYGLFGYIWIKSRFDAKAGFYLPPNIAVLFLVWFFLCFTGLLGNIGNYAHSAGLLMGVLISYTPVLIRKIQEK